MSSNPGTISKVHLLSLERKERVAMRSSDSAKIGMPRPALHYSRRDFLVVCLGFLGASCASSTTNTHLAAPLSTPTATPSTPQTTATAAARYHGTYSSQGGQIWGVSWSPDGTRIASASSNVPTGCATR
jgi:hypothetical protein